MDVLLLGMRVQLSVVFLLCSDKFLLHDSLAPLEIELGLSLFVYLRLEIKFHVSLELDNLLNLFLDCFIFVFDVLGFFGSSLLLSNTNPGLGTSNHLGFSSEGLLWSLKSHLRGLDPDGSHL